MCTSCSLNESTASVLCAVLKRLQSALSHSNRRHRVRFSSCSPVDNTVPRVSCGRAPGYHGPVRACSSSRMPALCVHARCCSLRQRNEATPVFSPLCNHNRRGAAHPKFLYRSQNHVGISTNWTQGIIRLLRLQRHDSSAGIRVYYGNTPLLPHTIPTPRGCTFLSPNKTLTYGLSHSETSDHPTSGSKPDSHRCCTAASASATVFP